MGLGFGQYGKRRTRTQNGSLPKSGAGIELERSSTRKPYQHEAPRRRSTIRIMYDTVTIIHRTSVA